ncbi:Putative WBSCR19-like protein 6 [Cricetulus griseus]|uniref:Putative WBSCR19-like protein 6 n=1 Tax=Cricetulus griseus TaxID=10029 RepID=G3H012_CRIGR|nr:Putative WBSCR19-like protein 6 [Cricetulus griseus]
MVVEYFGRLGLPGHLYNRIHFFLALYIACDMEEDDPISRRSIFQFSLGRDTWQDLYKDFQRLQKEFLQVIDYRAWVTRQECEEVCQGPARGVGRQGSARGMGRQGTARRMGGQGSARGMAGQGSARGMAGQGHAQGRTSMSSSSWTHLSFPFQIQNQNPHHWVWSRVRQSAP